MEIRRMESVRHDMATINRTIELFATPTFELGGVVELRALNTRRATISGYFDSMSRKLLAHAAAEWSGAAMGVYLMPHPVMPDCLARAANRIEWYAKNTTTDD